MKVAIAQYAPNPNDIDANIIKFEEVLADASSKGIRIISFGETWLSGYPAWIDTCPEAAYWDHEPVKEAFLQLRKNALSIPSPPFERLLKACADHQITAVVGINEVVHEGKAQGTVYNSLLTIGPDGKLLNHHRKLMPTFTERMIYGQGDGHGLKSVTVDDIKVTSAICWEHWMPLTRQALHDAGEHVHVAVWPWVHEKHLLASRQYAFEGRCYVLAAGQIFQANQLPEQLKLPDQLKKEPNSYILKGNSCIIDPRGDVISEQLYEKEGLVIAEINRDMVEKERMNLDITGHYHRPDVFSFETNKKRY